jgi:hypothetical protein
LGACLHLRRQCAVAAAPRQAYAGEVGRAAAQTGAAITCALGEGPDATVTQAQATATARVAPALTARVAAYHTWF